MVTRALAATALVLILGGCSTIKGWFGSKQDEKPTEPAELIDITPSVAVSKLWSANAGKGEERLGLQQTPAIDGGRVYAAAVEGGVRAFDLQTGKQVWQYKSDLRLSGGPGAGQGLVVVGTLNGQVIALDAATGAEKWQVKVPNEVISAPAIAQGLVFVRTNDGRVSALSIETGERRWFWSNELPSLTVRGNAPVVVGPGVLFAGSDDGTLTALSSTDGRPLWTQAVGTPEGRSELERMADVDGAPVLEGTTVFATSFKKETIAIEGPSGRPLWKRESGGAGGLAVTSSAVLVSDPAGTVWALDKYSGGSLWSNTTLARRSLTAPTIHGDYAVVGDYDGYLHWLKTDNGDIVGRARVGGKAIRGKPVVADGILVVQDVEGGLTAFGFK
ncbi:MULTISPECIES: outer membrane protein assembly factor BamB [unclassified Pseudoxanthomonas]|uniref:outer membrane protein assembly factor BamB n=1 Tax=unclassified Pseudoxanthomonas TaxID=2645906 RepID=UPI0008F03E24|nr:MULTISPECIES: outer membrane protein assembly factor BamB [unclassified Pseudoxanthomonas]PPJ42775.1 outer membrane protein assembly factor BamB [Pseudoxanthomonas sp. KAs_5_3]SFV26316.1 Beta-barrel assembly machine subunit BamB [Pseudoxanthomonas sp. YR558]